MTNLGEWFVHSSAQQSREASEELTLGQSPGQRSEPAFQLETGFVRNVPLFSQRWPPVWFPSSPHPAGFALQPVARGSQKTAKWRGLRGRAIGWVLPSPRGAHCHSQHCLPVCPSPPWSGHLPRVSSVPAASQGSPFGPLPPSPSNPARSPVRIWGEAYLAFNPDRDRVSPRPYSSSLNSPMMK